MGLHFLGLFVVIIPLVASDDDCQYPKWNNDSFLPNLNISYDCSDPGNVTILVPQGASKDAPYRIYHPNTCISRIPTNICDFPNIQAIKLPSCFIKSIPSLSCLRNLVVLDLYNNDIEILRNDTFVGLSNLRIMNLRNNKIRDIQRHTFTEDLESLKYVLLFHNKLKTSEAWPLAIKHSFCFFDLSHNEIERFSNNNNWTVDISEEYGPGMVDFSNNKFRHWITDQLKLYGFNELSTLGSLIYWGFDFRDNPWNCDCRMHEFLKVASNFYETIRRNYLQVYCHSPPSLKGTLIVDVPLSLLVCNVTEKCPPGCFCQDQPDNQQMLVDCQGKGLTVLPSQVPEGDNLALILRGNSIKSLEWRPYLRRTKILDVSQNELVNVSSEVVKVLQNKIKILNIAHNSLKHLPKEIQNIPFSRLVLDGNDFACDCENTWMARWLRQQNQNASEIFCYDEDNTAIPAVKADDDFLQCRSVSPFPRMLSVLLGTMAVIFILVVILLIVFRYEAIVTFHSTLKKVQRRRNKNVEFDIFLSVDVENEQDRHWVINTLLPELETRHNLNLYIPFRDMDPGTVTADETIRTLQKCHSALIILSDSCLSESLNLEFSQAYSILVRQRIGRVVIVRSPDIKTSSQRYLKAFLRLGMCINRSDPKVVEKIAEIVKKEKLCSTSMLARLDSQVTFSVA